MAAKNRSYAKKRGCNSEGDARLYCPAQGEDDSGPRRGCLSIHTAPTREQRRHRPRLKYLFNRSTNTGREGFAEGHLRALASACAATPSG